MKMKNKYIITYCSNIFKNNNVLDLFYNLNKYKKELKGYKNISICLSNKIIKEINDKRNIEKILNWTKINKKNIPLINGFVYKNFHQKLIKEKIYYPDWTKKERLNFTKNIIFFAQKLNKKSKICGISTLPITYNIWIKKNIKYNLKKTINYFFDILNILMQIKKYKNILIHIDIEPEPFCFLESCKDFIYFFKLWLMPGLKKKIKTYFNINTREATKIIAKHLNLCFDTCHSAVMFENEKKSLDLIRQLKIKIGRVQVSSAIKIKNINNKNFTHLTFLKKSPFLHQSLIKMKNLTFIKTNDFKNIKIINNNLIKEIRIHCHVPIYIKKILKYFETTQKELKNSLINIIKHNDTRNLEIETYTYNILYKKKNNKIKSMIKEYNWINNLIKNNI
ncbi:MAG TPA: metabolite traffic protein EboE [Candidatus Azoamicus sp. MARI]